MFELSKFRKQPAEAQELIARTIEMAKKKKEKKMRRDFKKSKDYIFKICAMEYGLDRKIFPVFEKYGVKNGNLILDVMQSVFRELEENKEYYLFQYANLNKKARRVFCSISQEEARIFQDEELLRIFSELLDYYFQFFVDKRLYASIESYQLQFDFVYCQRHLGEILICFKEPAAAYETRRESKE